MVAHAFNASTRETEAGGFWVWGQPGLQSKFQDSQGYTEKLCLENNNNNNNNPNKQKDIPWLLHKIISKNLIEIILML